MLHEMLNDKKGFSVMRSGNAITSQALKPGLWNSVIQLGMLNSALLSLFYMKKIAFEISTQ